MDTKPTPVSAILIAPTAPNFLSIDLPTLPNIGNQIVIIDESNKTITLRVTNIQFITHTKRDEDKKVSLEEVAGPYIHAEIIKDQEQ